MSDDMNLDDVLDLINVLSVAIRGDKVDLDLMTRIILTTIPKDDVVSMVAIIETILSAPGEVIDRLVSLAAVFVKITEVAHSVDDVSHQMGAFSMVLSREAEALSTDPSRAWVSGAKIGD